MATKKRNNLRYDPRLLGLLLLCVVLAFGIFLGINISDNLRSDLSPEINAIAAYKPFSVDAGKGSKKGTFLAIPTPSLTYSQDSISPTIKITAPKDQESFSTYVILVSADASDNTGISYVEFFADNVLLCRDLVSPYQCDYSIPPKAGVQHVIKAVAYDLAHNSASDTITINIYPRTFNRGRN